jgi:ADP-ribosylglycohydrolase
VDRAHGALAGLALGDALGMPTQSLTREEIVKQFEEIVSTFYGARVDHPFASGLTAGTVTDDTEQTLILADELLSSPDDFDPRHWAERLLAWEDDVRRRGLLDLLGPSTKTALANLVAGMDVSQTGRGGTTNGAAMRIAPVGIVTPSNDLTSLVRRVTQVSAITHNTATALSAAAAVAAVVSAGIDDATLDVALTTSLAAARLVEGAWPASPVLVSDRIEEAILLGRRFAGTSLIAAIEDDIGTSLASEESVPAAFATLVAADGDGWRACCVAASLGGDTDTISAMTGAMSGALWGLTTFPAWAVAKVERTNHLDLERVAVGLIRRRA